MSDKMVLLKELDKHFQDDNLEAPLVMTLKKRGVNGKLFNADSKGWAVLKDLPTGELFKRKRESNKVFLKGNYSRKYKDYGCIDFDDTNSEIFLKSNTKVFVNFTF